MYTFSCIYAQFDYGFYVIMKKGVAQIFYCFSYHSFVEAILTDVLLARTKWELVVNPQCSVLSMSRFKHSIVYAWTFRLVVNQKLNLGFFLRNYYSHRSIIGLRAILCWFKLAKSWKFVKKREVPYHTFLAKILQLDLYSKTACWFAAIHKSFWKFRLFEEARLFCFLRIIFCADYTWLHIRESEKHYFHLLFEFVLLKRYWLGCSHPVFTHVI